MRTRKLRSKQTLVYALVGSSLLCQAPGAAYAEEAAEAPEQPTAAAQTFTLEGVEVTANRERVLPAFYPGGQVARQIKLGVLGEKDFMDTPFNVTAYTEQTIANQQAATLQDVLLNDPSVRFTTSSGHIQENFSIRGYSVLADEVNFNGMQGLAPRSHTPVEFLERVEVQKGPGSFLNGNVNGAVGGTVNLVPKRAGETDVTTLTTDYLANGQLGGHIDIGRRFGKDKQFGVRFNGVYKDGRTATDGQSKERLLAALGLDYRQDKWRVSMDAYGSQESFRNGSVSMYDLHLGVVDAPDGSTNLLKGTEGTSRNNAILLKGEYDLNDRWSAYGGIGMQSSTTTGYLSGNHAKNVKADGTADVARNNQYWWTDTVSSEFGVRGKYQTGAVQHQLVLGSSYSKSESASAYNAVSGSTNIYNPVTFTTFAAAPARPGKSSEKELSSVFLADTLAWNQDKTQLTLGLRHQTVTSRSFNASTGAVLNGSAATYEASANTPVVGLIVKPWGDDISLYANYIEGLSGGQQINDAAAKNFGQVLAPYKSKQHEFGVKWDNGRFANTLSFFQITQPSQVKQYLNAADYNISYDGEQENRGIEWSTFGKVRDNLRILGGVTYLHGKLARTEGGLTDGKTPAGIPEWMMNIGAEWDTPWDPDLTLSLRAIYTSSQYINNTNTLQIPSWIRYDVGASYKTEIDHTPVVFRASVENVFNKNYWAGSFNTTGYVTLGSPRTFKLSATMQF